MAEIIKQRQWTTDLLLTHGYKYFPRKKELIMAGRLPASAAPMRIEYAYETVYADAGDIICFSPGKVRKAHLRDYDHWSIKADIFRVTYKQWDIPNWNPNSAEMHLMTYGCLPYYKHHGVWAKRLKKPTLVLTLESTKPALTPAGVWIAVGSQGEPWHMDNATFSSRYLIEAAAG